MLVSGSAPSNAVITFYVADDDEGEIFLPGTGVVANVDGIFRRAPIDLSQYVERNVTATATVSGQGTSAFGAPREIHPRDYAPQPTSSNAAATLPVLVPSPKTTQGSVLPRTL